MKRDNKENLKAAFDELNAPDKDDLLRKIESKKALGGEFDCEFTEMKKPRLVAMRRSFVALSCIFVLAIVGAICGYAFSRKDGGGNTYLKGNYRDSWHFVDNYRISFSDVEMSITDFCEQKDAGGLLPDLQEWTSVKSQITQGEGAFRQIYLKDGLQMEISVFTESNLVGLERKYKRFLSFDEKSEFSDAIVYTGEYIEGGEKSDVYVVYEKKAVYFICLSKATADV